MTRADRADARPTPSGLWRQWARDVRGQAMAGGHFFPEDHLEQTARLVCAFLDGTGRA